MRPVLLSYFDLGASYGIGDAVFPEGERAAPPDILQVGIRNPLGDGLTVDLLRDAPDVVAEWRRVAVALIERREMELGWTPAVDASEEHFKARLRTCLEGHPIARCDLTILAIGTVLVRLELASGLSSGELHGVSHCFEFAGYTAAVAERLRNTALARVRQVFGEKDNALARLSRRPDPAGETDRTGHTELKLLTSFSSLLLCTDEGDETLLPEVLASLALDDGERVPFEYHGTLHFGWGTCVLVPRNLRDPDETPDQQIARMVTCIEIAHAFLGTCEAFQKLFVSEIFDQVGHFVAGGRGVRTARDLNRLRTLAMAVVSLTSFAPVAAAEEDQKYFALFERHAGLARLHGEILGRCDLLYNVQDAETQAEESERQSEDARQQKRLNGVLLVLTGLTFISVMSDSYNFLREGERHLIPQLLIRLEILTSMAMAIVLLMLVVLYVSRAGRRRKR